MHHAGRVSLTQYLLHHVLRLLRCESAEGADEARAAGLARIGDEQIDFEPRRGYGMISYGHGLSASALIVERA